MHTPIQIQIHLTEEEGRRHDQRYSVPPGTTINELFQSRSPCADAASFTILVNGKRVYAHTVLKPRDRVSIDLNIYDGPGRLTPQDVPVGTHVTLNGAGLWSYQNEVKKGQYLEGIVVDANTHNIYWPVVRWNHGREERFQISKLKLNLPLRIVGNELRLA